MKALILALALSLGINGNIHCEKMMVVKNVKTGCVLMDGNGDIWSTETKVKGARKGKKVRVWMSDNDTPDDRYDDIIVKVGR